MPSNKQAVSTAQWGLARHALERSILANPRDVMTCEKLLEVLLQVKDFGAAEFLAKHLLKINPGHPRAKNLLREFAEASEAAPPSIGRSSPIISLSLKSIYPSFCYEA